MYGNYGSYPQTTTCDQFSDCVTFFSGTLLGDTAIATVTLAEQRDDHSQQRLRHRRSLYGEYANFCIQGCYDSYQWSTYVFSGYWPNG